MGGKKKEHHHTRGIEARRTPDNIVHQDDPRPLYSTTPRTCHFT
jgi:hypothetical protein